MNWVRSLFKIGKIVLENAKKITRTFSRYLISDRYSNSGSKKYKLKSSNHYTAIFGDYQPDYIPKDI